MSSANSSESDVTRRYFVNFNQDSTSLSVGGPNGYKLYSLSNVDNLEQIHCHAREDTRLVERLFSSSLVAVVTVAAPRKLKVCHFKKGTEICNYSYSNTILAVKLNRQRLVVCLEESLYIHNIRDMKVVHTIRDTPPNPQGLCALSINHEHCFLAYPGSLTVGEVQVFDAVNLHAKTMIAAHTSPLAALAFCANGTQIATASEKGTVIRVFSSLDGTSLYEFRRGVKRCVTISSLAFSICGQFLISSSNTETVHVFKLEDPKNSPKHTQDEAASWMGLLTTYLPTQVAGVFNQFRAFAWATVPFSNLRNVVTITTIQNQPRLLVATEEGDLYVYNLNTTIGGELTLYKKHELLGMSDASGTTHTDGASHSEPVNIESQPTGSAILGSYAGIVKGNPIGLMSGTESEKLREMAAATESPPKNVFQFNDDQEYPPLSQTSD